MGRRGRTGPAADPDSARFLPPPGAVPGRLGTAGNISAEEGGSVTLQCHLSSTSATVTQVDWTQQGRFLAIHHAESGWSIYPAFRERVVPRPDLGLTLQALTANDTGVYSCIYHTFPDGIYRGRLFLEVLRSSGMLSRVEQKTNLSLQEGKCTPAMRSGAGPPSRLTCTSPGGF